MRVPVLVVLLSVGAWAGSPKLEARVTKWQGGNMTVDVSVSAKARDRIVIGGPRKAWQQAITLEVFDADGVKQRWPLVPRESRGALQSIELTRDMGGGKTFELSQEEAVKLKPGAYEVIATLDLTGAGGGFEGMVRASAQVTIEGAARTAGESQKVDLAKAISKVRTRSGLMQVESLLVDAPELEPGPALDKVVTGHLERLAIMMQQGHGFTSKLDSFEPRSDLVREQEALLTPFRVSSQFALKFGKAKLTRAADLDAFSKWTSREKKGFGLHVVSVRTLGNVARVATVVIQPEVYERRVEISFWQRDGSGWMLLSFEPYPSQARDLWSNVYPGGEAKKEPSELTDVERKQYLEFRLGVVEMTTPDYSGSLGDAVLSRGFGAGHIDAGYVPFLEAALARTRNSKVRGAVMAELMELGKSPSDAVAIELLSDETLGADARSKIFRQLEKKLRGGRKATTDEVAALVAVEARPPEYRGQATARIIDDDLAVLVEDNMSRGQDTLFRKVDGTWKRVTGMSFWIH